MLYEMGIKTLGGRIEKLFMVIIYIINIEISGITFESFFKHFKYYLIV